jgi:hypothetical protein
MERAWPLGGTMPSANTSVYMRMVVNGVRSSWGDRRDEVGATLALAPTARDPQRLGLGDRRAIPA